MYWEQGFENLKIPLNKLCIYGWKKLNPDWDIRILDKKSVLKYFPELANFNHLTIQTKSDLIRIKLLNKYGGVWADASTLPMKPLTNNIDNIDNGTGVFFYRYNPPSKNNHYISNWFIIAKQPNHYLINKLANTFEERVKDKNKKYPYFYFHDTLTDLYNTDNKIKKIIDTLTITQDLSHAPQLKKSYPALTCENIDKQPLVYKRPSIKKEIYHKYLECLIQYKLVIVGIFKNEAHILREWLDHYIKQGVEHFYLTDNGSTDNWQSQITNLTVTIRKDTEVHQQAWHYNQYLDTVKKNAEWVLVVDLDEFMYARFDKDLPTALSKYDKNIGQIKVRMK